MKKRYGDSYLNKISDTCRPGAREVSELVSLDPVLKEAFGEHGDVEVG